MTEQITQAELKNRLSYNEATGVFTWNIRSNPRMRPDKVAGYAKPTGYVLIKLRGKNYLAHRLAWLYVHGHFPDRDIDHIDRNPNNNRISNLRLATATQNSGNRNLAISNKSGYRGVSYNTIARKYYAHATEQGRRYYLGTFDTPQEASEVVEARRKAYYGEFNSVPPPPDGECFYCGEKTESLAGDPGRWPLQFCHPDGTGISRFHHTRCVTDRLSPDPTPSSVEER